jgi:serine/threonine protein kinase
MIGRTIGTFQIIAEIGSGGIGKVFAGIDQMLERQVAIKVLKPELKISANVMARFHTEAITLARLNHPNIATVYAFIDDQDDYFLVMEYIRGWELQHIILNHGPLPLGIAIPLFQQTLEGISYAHKRGIIHRDIKPTNVMLTELATIKVMDFGIARALGTEHMTREGHLVGTLEYMSPEQVQGKETDVRSDIYSLSILLYEMVTGRVPFVSDSEYNLMKSQVEMLPPPPSEFNPDIPPTLANTILQNLAKIPEERFQTVDELSHRLACCMNNLATPALTVESIVHNLKVEKPLPLDLKDQVFTHRQIQHEQLSSAPINHNDSIASDLKNNPRSLGKFWSWFYFTKSTIQSALNLGNILHYFESVPYLGFYIAGAAIVIVTGIFYFGVPSSTPEQTHVTDTYRMPPSSDINNLWEKPAKEQLESPILKVVPENPPKVIPPLPLRRSEQEWSRWSVIDHSKVEPKAPLKKVQEAPPVKLDKNKHKNNKGKQWEFLR